MLSKTSKFERGFTLIEMIVSIFVFAIIMVGVLYLVSNLFRSSTQQSQLISDADQARQTAKRFANEIRNATIANTGAYAIAEATPQEIIFYTNLNGGTAVERVRYYVQNSVLYRGETVPTGSPFTYNSANEKTAPVQTDLANGSTDIFYYYDDTYDGSSNNYLTQPINLNNVKFIKINLVIYNKGGISNNATFTVTDSATIRNLKTNLGN